MKTVMSFKVDKDVRDNARRVAKRIGVPLSMVVNRQLKQFAKDQRIEFGEPLVPNAKTAKLLRKIEADFLAGRNMSPAFRNAKEMDAYLDALK